MWIICDWDYYYLYKVHAQAVFTKTWVSWELGTFPDKSLKRIMAEWVLAENALLRMIAGLTNGFPGIINKKH
jgi:hypothetical protein